jgi:streptogramin lyase
MLKNLQSLSLSQRRFVFFLIFGGILALLVGVTAVLIASALTSSQRQVSVALDESLTVREFAALPGGDAYPASVAVATDGTIYTGSFASGAIFRVSPDGSAVTEMPGTRDAIGAALGMTVAGDALLVIDRLDSDPRGSGGALVRVPLDGSEIDTFFAIPPDGFVSPHDVAVDGDGRVYVSDSGTNQVWRFDADGGSPSVWWIPPAAPVRRAINGLAYDPTRGAMMITEPEQNIIYRVTLADSLTEVFYAAPPDERNPPGFNGITITPDGIIYVAAQGQNGIALMQMTDPPSETGAALTYIAGAFRGASDVAFDPTRNRLLVTNFDQASLVLPLVQPQLPFALDVIELPAPAQQIT